MARNNFDDLDRFNDLLDANAKSVKYNRNLNQSWGKSLSVVRSEILILAFAINSFRKTIGATIQAYQEWENVQKRISQALDSTGYAAGITADEILKLNTVLEESTAIAETYISNSSAILLTFTNISKGIFEETQKAVLDMTVAMNQGKVSLETLKSTSIQVGKALNNPIKGINALARNGVKFTSQQKTQIKTLLLQNDIMGAQKIILSELKKEFGGQSEIKDFSFTLREFGKELGNLSKDIGGALSPTFIEVTKNATELVKSLNPDDIKRFTIALFAVIVPLKMLRNVLFVVSTLGMSNAWNFYTLKFNKMGGAIKWATIQTKLFNIAIKTLSSSLGLLLVGGGLAYLFTSLTKAREEIDTLGGAAADAGTIDDLMQLDSANFNLTGINTKLGSLNDQISKLKKDTSSAKGVQKFFENILDVYSGSKKDYLGEFVVDEGKAKEIRDYVENTLGLEGLYIKDTPIEEFTERWKEMEQVIEALPLEKTAKDKIANTLKSAFGGGMTWGGQTMIGFDKAFIDALNESIETLEDNISNTQGNVQGLSNQVTKFNKKKEELEKPTSGATETTEYLQNQIDKYKMLTQEQIHLTGAKTDLFDATSSLSEETHKELMLQQDFGKLLKKLGIPAINTETGEIYSLKEAFDKLNGTLLESAMKEYFEAFEKRLKDDAEQDILREKLNSMKNLYLSFAEDVTGILGDFYEARLDRQQEAQMQELDNQLTEVDNLKMSERKKEQERKKIEAKREALKKKHHNEDIELKKKMVLVKWSPFPGGPAIAATENAANKAIMMANIGFSSAAAVLQLASLDKQKYAQGGYIGGRLHSQGGTLIEAERGEFIMSRDAVNRIGLDNLYNLNQGVMQYGKGGYVKKYQDGGAINMAQKPMTKSQQKKEKREVVVNISGNILSEDFIVSEAIPIIKDALRRGEDIGI